MLHPLLITLLHLFAFLSQFGPFHECLFRDILSLVEPIILWRWYRLVPIQAIAIIGTVPPKGRFFHIFIAFNGKHTAEYPRIIRFARLIYGPAL